MPPNQPSQFRFYNGRDKSYRLTPRIEVAQPHYEVQNNVALDVACAQITQKGCHVTPWHSNLSEPSCSYSTEPSCSSSSESSRPKDEYLNTPKCVSTSPYACATQLPPAVGLQHTEKDAHLNTDHNNTSIYDHLNDRMGTSLSLNALQKLRKLHGLSSYIRSRTEILKALRDHICTDNCSLRYQSHPSSSKRSREEKISWPVIISDEERNDIISEFVDRTSFSGSHFVECSFCGVQTHIRDTKEYCIDKLDISLLLSSREFLRERTKIPRIEIAKSFENKFLTCAGCSKCIRRNRFTDVPLYSYANGCWVGDIPEELQGLSLLEELCIARVRSTRCTIKLSTGKLSQYGSHGNVCVFPQEPKNLISVLPPPLHSIYDEVAVILVNNKDSNVTEELMRKSPLLVRRHKLINALTWLKEHNKLYSDIVISTENLNEYTDDGILRFCPAQHIFESESEGASYTAERKDSSSNVSQNLNARPAIQTCGVLDSDQQERSQALRKMDMIKELLTNKIPYVNYPNASSEPLPTFKNYNLYPLLWPTLFPYGVGSFEDDVRNFKSNGFRNIAMKRHIKHLLNLTDTRFQKHVMFPFVMMNLLQRRVSSFESKLIVQRSFFPKVIDIIKKIDVDDLETVKNKLLNKIPLGDNEVEKSVSKLLNYVNFISEDICGSIGEVKKMKSEIRSIMRVKGLPHLFLTVNPADTMNPIMQVFAGRKINLNKIFDDLSNGNEEFERLRSTTQNPASTARAFDTVMKVFTDILLGKQRDNQLGVFGPVESYYGVVEAQGRGSLHCHFFIWLKDGMDPFQIRDKLKANEAWRKHFFSWLESSIKQDLPTGTVQQDFGCHKKEPVMSRPQSCKSFVSNDAFKKHFEQDLRNLLHVTGQIHEHSFTCFKHLSSISPGRKFEDSDCRFGLPREKVPFTYLDDDGHLHLVCKDGNVNGYNDVIVYCLRCNMDCKFIGSGTAAYAMTEYVTNYIAKITLDSSAIFSCLCAALSAIYKNHNSNNQEENDASEQARLLLLKICNGMIGKRELSGQQVTSYLQNIPNRYTDHKFETFWWTSLLKFISPEHFVLEEDKNDDGYVMIHDGNMHIDISTDRNLPSLVADYLYRPSVLQNICLWDFWSEYKTCCPSKTNNHEDDDNELSSSMLSKTYSFSDGHPKQSKLVMRARNRIITPILNGIQIPRSDKDPGDREKFQVIVLTLFKPWSTESALHTLKDPSLSWQEAYNEIYESMTDDHKNIVRNFQAIYSCKDAADDYSKKRAKSDLRPFDTTINTFDNIDLNTDNVVQDENWNNAMNTEINVEDELLFENDVMDQYFSNTTNTSVIDALNCATSAGFYTVLESIPILDDDIVEGCIDDSVRAQKEYDTILNGDYRTTENLSVAQSQWNNIYNNDSEPIQQIFNADQQKLAKVHSLYPHRKLCLDIIKDLTLNHEQALAFLLFADKYGLRYCVPTDLQTRVRPVRLLISGPGGTGKSQIFQAIKCFLHTMGHGNRIKMTAPTGLAANNIGGSTVHSEINIRIPPRDMLSNNAKGKSRRETLEKKYTNINTQVIDEIYFMSARDNALLSQYLNLANHSQIIQSYGNLNMIFAGDPAQLPPPKQMSLFDHRLVKQAERNLNATNDSATMNLSGVVIWHEITDCIVLSQIMRQKDPFFQDILSRLRFGNCTEKDYDELQRYVVRNRTPGCNKALLDISLWVTNPENASPLITYTNALRDAHNTRCAEAFALYTRQPYYEYHAVDTVNRGKTVLTNIAAQAAWNTPVKHAHDLAGKLPLIPQMPIFLTQNLATHLGLSNGATGKLISAKYVIKNGLRYAISAVIHVDRYKGGPSEHPHRLTIVPVKTTFTFNLRGNSKKYSATRTQLPIIPAFAFTSHNSQSRSLNTACIDLESCPNSMAAYVMLSRIRCLSGLSILRPFTYKKISRHCPQEIRDEVKRLDRLHAQTIDRSKTDLKWYYDVNETDKSI